MTNGINGNIIHDYRIPPDEKTIEYAKSTLKAAGVDSAAYSDSLDLGTGFAVGSGLIFEGIPFGLYLKRNAKINNIMTKDMVNLSSSTQKALKDIKTGKGSVLEKVCNFFDVINKNNLSYYNIRDIADGKANLKERAESLNKAKKALAENPGILGYRKLSSKIANLRYNWALKNSQKPVDIAKLESANSGGLARMKNILKSSNAGFMVALSGLIEGITEIYPTFRDLGFEKGMKQLGKSSVKIICDTAGFIAGQQAGMAIGSAIGTALFPGVGTAIGAVTGIIIGSIGAAITGNIAEKIVGKSELELAGLC